MKTLTIQKLDKCGVDGRPLWGPANDEDFALFLHLSGSASSVRLCDLAFLQQVAEFHGVKVVTLETPGPNVQARG